ncbi:MAG TPA: MoxR family ATPase [Pseudomonadota bacterium]|nr:MoxR family ATPase [Pseudomonadota bacterium]
MPSPRLSGIHNGRDGAPYHPSDALLAAANTALLLNTPLLLAGEPGCGKTDFAWYAARALAGALGQPNAARATPLACYVRSDLRARDLLYQYDALARFADAQHPPPGEPQRAQDARNYITLSPLGVGLMSKTQRVVLIDEIDKAPRDVPNDLLRELDQGHFAISEIPDTLAGSAHDVASGIELCRHMQPPGDAPRPLVIVTSNAERQLPDAFLRRCVFFHIPFPDEDELRAILSERVTPDGRSSQPAAVADTLAISKSLRDPALRLIKPPGTAELIGFLRAVLEPGREMDFGKLPPLSDLAERARKNERIPWRKLPALHCLIKLKEDLDTLDRLSPQT